MRVSMSTLSYMAQLILRLVNSDVPLTAGIVIITAIVFVLCFWGLGVVQFWERYAWGV
jgi:purine-cytosine permease-like protein